MSKFSLRTAYAVVAVLIAAGCDDGLQPERLSSLAVAPESHTLQVGESHQFTAGFEGGNSPVEAVLWSSLNPDVATVSTSGMVVGVRPGETAIVAEAGGAADTSHIEVTRTPAQITIEPLAGVAPGDVVQLRAAIVDTEGEPMTGAAVAWSVSAPTIASVDAQGRLTAHTEGTVIVTGVARPVSAEVEVVIRTAPPPEGCANGGVELAVGEVRRYKGGTPLSLCLAGGAEYTLVTANAGAAPISTLLAGEGMAEPGAPPMTDLLAGRTLRTAAPAEPRLDRDFERRLRRRERDQLSPAGARSRILARSMQTDVSPVAVGDLMNLNTSTSCSAPEARVGRVRHVGERAIVVADTANPAGVTAADYASFGALYDTLLYPVVTEHFGEPAGMNGERRVVIFYTRAVNELTPAGSQGVVGGFFWAGDLFARSSCAGSNEREMFYMLAADPQGVINGNPRSVEYVRRVTAGTIAHELQHLINASRRIFINDSPEWEEPWLNEGLSHIAEELVFYDRLGSAAGNNLGAAQLGGTQQRLDVTNRYGISNLMRLDEYLRDPERQGPFQDDDDLATRGASWQYLRYAIDRHGGDERFLLSSLVDSRTSGLANLEAVFGADPRMWFVDDVTGLYADDAVSGAAAVHRHPSWNFRSLFDWINDDGFGLRTRELRDGESASLRLQAWGTAYFRTAVSAARIASVRVGSAEAPPPASLRLVLMRTR